MISKYSTVKCDFDKLIELLMSDEILNIDGNNDCINISCEISVSNGITHVVKIINKKLPINVICSTYLGFTHCNFKTVIDFDEDMLRIKTTSPIPISKHFKYSDEVFFIKTDIKDELIFKRKLRIFNKPKESMFTRMIAGSTLDNYLDQTKKYLDALIVRCI